MDNGNKTVIQLDSPLDINSGDMLVSVNAPKFTYNRQKHLGSLLQNSIRYEADGWFAGWWQHNFPLASTRKDSVEPPLNDNAAFQILARTAPEGYTYYIATHKDIKLQYSFVIDQWSQWLTDINDAGKGTGVVSRTDSDTIHVHGITTLGDTFDVDVNTWDGSEISWTSATTDLVHRTYKTGQIYTLEVTRSLMSSDEYLLIRKNQPIEINGVQLTYKRDDTTSTWFELFTLDDATNTLTVVPVTAPAIQQYTLISQTGVIDAGLETEHVDGVFKDNSECIISTELTFTNKWVGDIYTSVAVTSEYVNSTSVTELCNTQEAQIEHTGEPAMIPLNTGLAKYMLPIWAKFGLKAQYQLVYDWGNLPTKRDMEFGFYTEDTTDYFRFGTGGNMELTITTAIAGKGLGTGPDAPVLPALIAQQYNANYNFNLGLPGGWTVNEIRSVERTPGDPTTAVNMRYYCIKLYAMPCYTEIGFLFTGGGQCKPAAGWQPYAQTENPTFDPRPLIPIPYSNALYGLNNYSATLHYNPRTVIQNPAKEQAALSVPDPSVIPDTITNVPDYVQYALTTYYTEVPGPDGTPNIPYANAVLEMYANPHKQENPTLPNYDPRPYVPVQNLWDGTSAYMPNPYYVEFFNDPSISQVNPNLDPAELIDTSATVNYSRSFFTTSTKYLRDYGQSSPYWSEYYHDTGFESPPSMTPDGPTAVVDPAWVDIVDTYSIFKFVTIPDAMTPDANDAYRDQPNNPPMAQRTQGTIRLRWNKDAVVSNTGDITYVDTTPDCSLHTMKNMADMKCTWYYKIIGRSHIYNVSRINYDNEWRTVSDRWYYWYLETANGVWLTGDHDNRWYNGIGPWHSLDEPFERTVYAINSADAHLPTSSDTGRKIFDEWEIILTCVNNNPMYPLPYRPANAPANTLPNSLTFDGCFFTVRMSTQIEPGVPHRLSRNEAKYNPNIYFTASENLLNMYAPWIRQEGSEEPKLRPGVYITVPTYDDVKTGVYGTGTFSNYEVLNTISPDVLNETGIWGMNTNTGILSINLPFCFKAYSYIDLTTPNILVTGKESFNVSTISNAHVDTIYNLVYTNPLDRPPQLRCFRFDDNGASYPGNNVVSLTRPILVQGISTDAQNDFTLNLATPEYRALTASGSIQKLMVIYNTTGRAPLYSLKVPCVAVDSTTGLATGWATGAYPAWITKGIPFRFSATENCTPYMPSAETMTGVNVSAAVDICAFMYGVTQNQSTNIESELNTALFTAIQPSFILGAITVPPPQITTPTNPIPIYQSLRINIGGNNYSQFQYDVRNKVFQGYDWPTTPPTPQPWVDNYPSWTHVGNEFLPLQTSGIPVQQNLVNIKVQTKAQFTLSFYRTFLLPGVGPLVLGATIEDQTDQTITLGPGNDYGTVDLGNNTLNNAVKVTFVNSVDSQYTLQLYVGLNNACIGNFVPQGIISRTSNQLVYNGMTTVGSFRDMEIVYQGSTHIVHIDMTPGASQFVQYLTKDIRTGEQKEVYRRDTNDIMMFVKQFWSNDVSTENFWWVDATHVLELTKYDMVLHVKDPDGEVHDWNGDLWDEIWRVPRSNFVSSADLYYACSSCQMDDTAANSRARFFKLVDAGPAQFNVMYIDVLASTFNPANITWTIAPVPVVQVAFGTPLTSNPAAICAYTPLVANAMLQASDISSTWVQPGILLIGVAMNRGLQQWTLKINGTAVTVVTGYGHVGVDGSLTGGMIPDDSCGANGFNKPVNTIETLPVTSTGDVPTTVVGTESKIWFVQKNVQKIVTHMLWSGSSHTPVSMWLNNNIAEDYKSLSFGNDRLFDVVPFGINIATLFTNNPAFQAIAGIISPTILTLNPKYTLFGYISHSVGQYAYKYYNSIQQQVDDKITDNDVTFGKRAFGINMARSADNSNMILQVVLKSIGGAMTMPEKASVNPDQNQSTTDDGAGRKFSQFAVDTVNSTVSSAMQATGFVLSLKSTLWYVRSLDMFYSIDNDTQCWAGPGFVNHNLQAQCIAQSATDVQVEAKRIAFWCMFVGLSIMLESLKLKGYQAARSALVAWMQAVGPSQTGTMPGPQLPTGLIIAAVAQAAIVALDALITVSEAAIDVFPSLAQALGGYPDGVAYLHGYISKHNLSVEGKHAYGNKSMSLFWPSFGVNTPVSYTNESVVADYKTEAQYTKLGGTLPFVGVNWNDSRTAGMPDLNGPFKEVYDDNLYQVQVLCRGVSLDENGIVAEDPTDMRLPTAPADMAVVEGTTAFLSVAKFKNEQIGVSPPVFPRAPIVDYCINKQWQLGVTAGMGLIAAVSCDDTKLLDGPASNIVISDSFCGVSSSYAVIEIKNVYDERYLRPYAVTPNAIALNLNRYNVVHDAKAYHAFDGQFTRIVKWTGGAGLDKEYNFKHYCFQINDHFKRSNIPPPNSFMGNFKGPPTLGIRSYEQVANIVESAEKNIGGVNDIPGELKDLQRHSIPVHSEPLSTLPAMNRMLAPYKLFVVEGVTGLVTAVRNMQTKYKAPSSVDFNINGDAFRATEEFICTVQSETGITGVKDVVASAGLTFVGATTKEGFFYSPATKLYYSFDGSDVQKREVMSRFITVDIGRWDFINQEIIFSATERYKTGDAPLVLRLDGEVKGEVWEPLTTIYNPAKTFGGGFKVMSMPGGLLYQGPKRFIVNRFIMLEHMIPEILNNKGKWRYVKRELDELDETSKAVDIVRGHVAFERDYKWAYENYDTETPVYAVDGWTHNPWCLVTSMLGTDEESDNKYEWTINFAWTPNMEVLIGDKEYITVNVVAETVTVGGRLFSRPTHLFLHKQLFERTGNGYYSAKYQSSNGAGNRERLYIWSDGYIALEDLTVDVKTITANRATQLITQVDISELTEF